MRAAPRRTRIKICGIRTPEEARAAIRAGADAIGVVRASISPRRVDARMVRAILDVKPPFVSAVGVYRDADPAQLEEDELCLWDLVQVHGDEDEEDLAAYGRAVLRGFAFDPEQARRWDACARVAALLIDGPAAGSGRTFDHTALAALMPELRKPVILAGGLTPANVGQAIRAVRPYGVDVSSGVESAPGVKDPALIAAFCHSVREADAQNCPK